MILRQPILMTTDCMPIEVFFGTNRNKVNDEPEFGTEINEEDSTLNFGKAKIKMDNDCKALEVLGVSNVHASKVVPSEEEEKICFGFDQNIFKEIKGRMLEGIDTIIFFHGFDNDFKESLEGADELKCLYEKEGQCEYTMIVFSWPSDGDITSYFNDRSDASKSGKVFAQGLKQMGQFLRGLCSIKSEQNANGCEKSDEENTQVKCGRVHIMAHSMGVYVLRHVLGNLCEIIRQENEENRIQDSQISKLIDEILLIAADEDSDAFAPYESNDASCQTKLYSLPELAERISIYFHDGDDALAVSDWFMSNPDRMGSIGLSNIHQVPSNVFLINCEKVIEESFWPSSNEHDYHKTNSAVIRDISYVLKGLKPGNIPERIRNYDLIKSEAVTSPD